MKLTRQNLLLYQHMRLLIPILFLPAALIAAEDKISFNKDIRTMFSNSCFLCHGPDDSLDEHGKSVRKAGLRLDTFEGATAKNKDGTQAIVPGDPEASEAFMRIISTDPEQLMPPPNHGDRFTPEQVELVRKWIEQGAKYETHWAYQKPGRPALPKDEAAPSHWQKNPVDAFVYRSLSDNKLNPSPEADRRTLARRVALDLTGVPPTPEEVAGFVSDESPDAYSKYVDRILAKPTYGEHWTRMWLDLARYADSAGYADDIPRTIWAYRDYVIRSFNENKPFDEFTVEQLAGDLLPNPTESQLVATAFHRNTQTNNEGGTNDEEFRNVAVVDRVNTTLATWMGTTMACAQCHTHKYDPITHEEYFQVFDIFNQTQDSDKRDEFPTMPLFSGPQREKKSQLQNQIAALEKSLAAPGEDPRLAASLSKWEQGLAATQWQVLQPVEPQAASGATLSVQEDGSLLATGRRAETDDYSFSAQSPIANITGVKVELLADQRLQPHSGPARTHNLVLNELTLGSEGNGSSSKRGRYVRIELPGKDRILHIAEVQAFNSGGQNLALSGKARQSTTGFDGHAKLAIDGITDGDYFKSNSVTHNGNGDPAAFWEVDLGAEHELSRIVVWNRTDSGLQPRLDGFRLQVLDANRQPVWENVYKKAPQRELVATLEGAQIARFARASASFEQRNFEADKAIDGDAGRESGWAIAGGQGRNHNAVFELSSPLPGGKLSLRLQQNYPNHAIGRFRILVTDATNPAPALPDDIAAIVATPRDQRDRVAKAKLIDYYAKHSPEAKQLQQRIAGLKRQLASMKPDTTVPILREVAAANRRETHVHLRGSYLSHGPKVSAGFIEALGPEGFTPANEIPNRLDLAQWILHENNPLTARVAANRFWEKIFGIGIVATSEEFGSQGEQPSHPELLDWLAVEFRESGWDTKKFLKLLVTSAAYKQSSHVTAELHELDPANRLLARGPRLRLSAEMVRDQALAVSGLLSPKMFGKPVHPPQPDLGLKAAFGGAIDWKTSAGEDKHRRGLYTTWRRSNPYPSMATFDAPNREVCVVRRDRTNTPLQALVTLNDPVYIEAAQAFARRLIREIPGESTAAEGSQGKRLAYAFELALLRPPTDQELERLKQFHQECLQDYQADTAQAKEIATNPIGPAPEGVKLPE
ncbi:MAG: DUF1553 domain-containing protein, partial [Akkermansiaceae bacterium]